MYPMLVSIVIILITSIPLMFLDGEDSNKPERVVTDTSIYVYPLVAFQGVGIAIMLNTATSLISDVIGQDAENSAFVYGCYSLFDKFANGILLYFLVETYTEDVGSNGEDYSERNEKALRVIMGLIPPACAVLSYLFTFIG